MVDKIIRIGIDSSLAERGAERVKNALKGVQREAAQTSGAEIDITADTSGIRAGIAEVNRALGGISGTSAEIPIGFDTTDIDRETAGIISRIKAEVDRNVGNGVSVEASLEIATEAAAAEVGRLLASLPDDIEIPLDIVTDTVIAELRRVAAEVERTGGSIEIGVTADEAEAEREIREIIRRRRDPVELPVAANTDRADVAIDRLTSQTRSPVNVPISVDADQARAEIDSVFE